MFATFSNIEDAMAFAAAVDASKGMREGVERWASIRVRYSDGAAYAYPLEGCDVEAAETVEELGPEWDAPPGPDPVLSEEEREKRAAWRVATAAVNGGP